MSPALTVLDLFSPDLGVLKNCSFKITWLRAEDFLITEQPGDNSMSNAAAFAEVAFSQEPLHFQERVRGSGMSSGTEAP